MDAGFAGAPACLTGPPSNTLAAGRSRLSSTIVASAACLHRTVHASRSQCPDPDGSVASVRGPYPGPYPSVRCSFYAHGGSLSCLTGIGGFLHGSCFDVYGGQYFHPFGGHYGGHSPHSIVIPSLIFPSMSVPGQPGVGPHAVASVASSLGDTSTPLWSLLHADARSLLGSDVTMSFPPNRSALLIPHIPPVLAPSVQVLPPATPAVLFVPPVHAPLMVPAAPTVIPLVVPAVPAVLPMSSAAQAKLLKLDPIKDAKAFLDSFETIQFYLRMPEFSHGHAEGSLPMDAASLDASRAWEGQLRLGIKDGNLCFLFENKGSLLYSCGFEMLAALIQNCRPTWSPMLLPPFYLSLMTSRERGS
jgi:hypothetical protein